MKYQSDSLRPSGGGLTRSSSNIIVGSVFAYFRSNLLPVKPEMFLHLLLFQSSVGNNVF